MSGLVSTSAFKLFAQTSPGLEATLLQELRNIGIKGRMRDDISHIQFQSNYEGLFKVLHEVRTIESLKIQIGPEFRARSEDELAKNLQKLPWNAFLPIERLHEFNQPQILSKSYRSNLYHEKLITAIVEKQMNLLNVRKEYKQLQTLTGGQGDRTGSRSLNKEIQVRKREIESRKQLIIDNRALQKNNDPNSNSNSLELLPQLPSIHLYLVKDKARVLLKLHLDSLHKHSLKPKVGWAPIKEGIVAGTLISMNFTQRFEKELKVWDPFCGSGSIVLELLSMMFQRKIRDKFDFSFLKNFPQEKYEQFLLGKLDDQKGEHTNDVSEVVNDQEVEEHEEETEGSLQHDEKSQDKVSSAPFGTHLQDISILGSDISGEAIKYSLENFRYSNLEQAINEFIKNKPLATGDNIQENTEPAIAKDDRQVSVDEEKIQGQKEEYSMNPKRQLLNKGIKDETKLNELAPFYIQETFCDKRVRFIRSDFETLSKMINLRGYTIITNLPFGIRSKEHIEDSELIGSFKRFAKVIQKNLHKLNDVFVYTTVHQKYHRDHFIHISQMSWTIKQKYNLGGIEIGLFQLNKDISATTKTYQVYDEQEAIQKEDKLAVLETKLSKAKFDNEELSQHLKDIIGDRSDKGLQRQSTKAITQKDAEQCSPALVPRGVKPQELALLTPRERNEQNRLLEQKDNMRNLKKAGEIEEAIKKELDKKAHTPRQIKSIAIRRKLEYAKALRLRALMQRDSYVQSQQEKEVERRIQSKRNRLNVEFIKSVMNSVGVEDKEEALDQIQEKLDQKAEQKVEKKKVIEKKRENKKKAPRWY